MRKIALLFYIICSLYIDLYAQTDITFSAIDSKDGLSDNRIRNIVQLGDGRMMIITDGVINIFDGTRFTQLHLKKGCIYPLSGYSGFHHSYVDKKYVWIKNLHQLYLFDKITGNYVLNPDSIFKEMGINEKVSDVFIDINGNHWIKTETDHLLFYNQTNKKLKIFCYNVSFSESEKDELYDVIVVKNRVYLFYSNGLMLCYSTDNRNVIYKYNSLDIPDRHLYNRTLMVAQKDNFLYLLRNSVHGIMQAFNTESNEWKTVLKTDYWLNTISIDKEHNIWVSCKEGLWKIDRELVNKQLYNTFNLIDGSDVTTEASTLYNDQQGGFWVGTFNHGILYFHSDRFKFKNIGKSNFGVFHKDLAVNAFVEYSPDIYLIATSEGMYFYHSNTNKLEPAPTKIRNLNCFKILKTNSGYILHTSTGFYVTDEQLSGLKSIFANNSLVTVLFDCNRVLFCNELKNCVLYNLTTDKTEPFRVKLSESAGNIWPQKLIVTNNKSIGGIDNRSFFIYNISGEKISFPLAEAEQSIQIAYTDIFYDSRGLYWLGTKDGLMFFDVKKTTHRLIHTDDGLINNSIKAITEDKNKKLWITTSGGISQISVTKTVSGYDLQFANFNRLDGVITSEFNEKSIYLSPNNVLLCGGINGMNIIDLKRQWRLTKLQKPIFTSLLLKGNEVKQGVSYDGNFILRRVISETDTVRLKYHQNFISLCFSALNYVNPTQTYYRYKLNGVDADWRETSSNNGSGMAIYTNLSPGTYKFEVFSANNSKKWSDNPAILIFIIKPPFWKTTFAYMLYFSLFVILIYFSISYYKRRTHKLLSQKNEEKLNQMKFRFFTNVSHEFRTPLTLVITPLESILKDVTGLPLENKLVSVYRNAQQLLQLVNQLLDFRRLESGGEKLKLSFGSISDFIRQYDVVFGKMAADRSVKFEIKVPNKEIFLYFDSDKLTKIMNNLLSNAFKFTSDGGVISVELTENNETVEITVTDNGKGIDAKDLPFIFDRFYQSDDSKQGSGIGLHMVSEYVKLHRGEIKVSSTIGYGSVFSFSMPLHTESDLLPNEKTNDKRVELNTITTIENNTCKVLVVEDNDELRHFLISELSDIYHLLEAKDGVEGLNIARNEMPDLIISDVLMPNMDGLEMCRKIKSDVNISHIPVILLTARAANAHRMDGYQAGADEYLAKPFNLDMLKLRANNLIENRLKRQRTFSEKIEINPVEITITSLDQQFITKALELIEKNMANGDYSVQQLSNDLCMDRTVLYKKIQSITGLAPLEFIRSMRLKRAAQLLEKGGLPVAEVALMTGFNTPKYFTKYFRETFGVNPSNYPSHESKTE